MDNRATLRQDESFLQILSECLAEGRLAEMIVDENGLDRVSGLIASISESENGKVINLETGRSILISDIVAVNGVFSAPYEGC